MYKDKSGPCFLKLRLLYIKIFSISNFQLFRLSKERLGTIFEKKEKKKRNQESRAFSSLPTSLLLPPPFLLSHFSTNINKWSLNKCFLLVQWMYAFSILLIFFNVSDQIKMKEASLDIKFHTKKLVNFYMSFLLLSNS